MKQRTAKTVKEVKEWVENTPHHIGYWEGLPLAYTHLTLQGNEERLRIPKAIHELCFFKPGGKFDSRIFRWDHKAEANKAAK